MKRTEKIFVTKAFLPPFDEFVEGLKPLWESAILTNQGTYHNQLTTQLNTYLKVPHSTLFVNGHQALEIGLKALELRGEVITTPFSFASTTHAIVQNGLTPVFCDIRATDGNIDESKIEGLISEKTCAIMPVHVYGNPCNIDEINKIARKYNLKVLFDAAHAFGVEVNGAGIGSFGDISMFSFHATKVFNTIEGGLLTYSDTVLEKKLYLLKNFGIAGPEDVVCVGSNAKMNEVQALMGLLNLKYVDGEIAKRERKVRLYKEGLAIPGIRFFDTPLDVRSNYAYFPILIDENEYGMSRDQLFAILADNKIFARKYFYPLISDYACYRDLYSSNVPVARKMASEVMTLPLWGDISDFVIEEIVETIRVGYRHG